MPAELDNEEIANRLALFSAFLDLAERSPFAVRAYARAADLVRATPTPVAALVREGRVRELRGIGPGIESKLRELVETGELRELDELQDAYPLELVGYGRLHGVSAKRMSSIARALEIRTIPDLQCAVANGRLLREGRGESDELALTARELGGAAPAPLLRHADLPHGLRHRLRDLLRRQGAVLEREGDLVLDAHAAERLVRILEILRHVARPAPWLAASARCSGR